MATVSEPSAAVQPRSPALRRAVVKLALPAVGEQVLNTLVGLSDTFLVGHLNAQASARLGYSSAEALAGVGLASQLIWLITVCFMAVSVGCTAMIARARGAGDDALANRVLRQSLLGGLAMGVLATLIGVGLARPMLQALGPDAGVLARGVLFLQIAASTFAPAALLFIGTAALRGVGDTRTPLVVMLGVNVVNIALSWLLINGNLGAPVLGVAGSAIGGPSGAEQLVFQGALLIFVSFVTQLGTAAYAAHNVVISIESLSFLPGLGYAIAASALVGQHLGAGEPELAEASTYEALRQCGLLMSLLGLGMMLLPHQLIALFVADPQVADVGAGAMRIAGAMQPLLALSFVVSGGLRGAGDTRWPLYSKLVSTWGVRLPLVLGLLALGWGLSGVWVAMSSDFAVQALLALWQFRRGRWKSLAV